MTELLPPVKHIFRFDVLPLGYKWLLFENPPSKRIKLIGEKNFDLYLKSKLTSIEGKRNYKIYIFFFFF